MTSGESLTLRARWVAPVSGPPIENGYVVTSDEYNCIIEVGSGQTARSGEVIDFGDAVILPGFVNAHTHLALTALRGRVPFVGSFVEWIKSLRVASVVLNDEATFRASLDQGLRESLAAGVTTVADIGCGEATIAAWQRAAIRVFGFLEVLGMGPKRWGGHSQSVEQAERDIRRAYQASGSVHLGLSPHAPYSTDRMIYKNAIQAGRMVCTHLAETKEELQFLRDGTGLFRDLLEEWNLWDGSFTPPQCTPIEYMKMLKMFDIHPLFAPLLAHVNYVTDTDLDLLARSPCSVAYCPRTHRFFDHEPHRYRDMLARGINVCIGTDSLASNDTLSVLDELRFLRRQDSQTDGHQLLSMGTLAGARALHCEDQIGAIEPGKRADLAVIGLNHPSAGDPVEDILGGDAPVAAVYIGGERLEQE